MCLWFQNFWKYPFHYIHPKMSEYFSVYWNVLLPINEYHNFYLKEQTWQYVVSFLFWIYCFHNTQVLFQFCDFCLWIQDGCVYLFWWDGLVEFYLLVLLPSPYRSGKHYYYLAEIFQDKAIYHHKQDPTISTSGHLGSLQWNFQTHILCFMTSRSC